MYFDPVFDSLHAWKKIPALIALMGVDAWTKRTKQLASDAARSAPQELIVHDHHWLEKVLADLAARGVDETKIPELSLTELAALQFTHGTLAVSRRLSSAGVNTLRGRLRDGLKSDSGFAPLHLEIEMSLLLLSQGFEIEWPDLEGTGQADLRFVQGDVNGEVECKSLSADAGRKVHRKDFYRFIESLNFKPGVTKNERRIVIVTVEDRFPAGGSTRDKLRSMVQTMLEDQRTARQMGPGFEVIQEALAFQPEGSPASWDAQLYKYCRARYGAHVHVSGPFSDTTACLIAVRSQQEDDISLPLLEAMKKAASQLTRGAGFVAVQFNDLPPGMLLATHVQRRNALISEYLFRSRDSGQIAGAYFCAYAGLERFDGRLATPGMLYPNRHFAGDRKGLPFHDRAAG